jgi:hypothetical protein
VCSQLTLSGLSAAFGSIRCVPLGEASRVGSCRHDTLLEHSRATQCLGREGAVSLRFCSVNWTQIRFVFPVGCLPLDESTNRLAVPMSGLRCINQTTDARRESSRVRVHRVSRRRQLVADRRSVGRHFFKFDLIRNYRVPTYVVPTPLPRSALSKPPALSVSRLASRAGVTGAVAVSINIVLDIDSCVV